MTTRIEIEWEADNLRSTAEHLLSSGSAAFAVGTTRKITTVGDAKNFLLERFEEQVRNLTIPTDLRDFYDDAFVAYKSIWVSLLLSKGTAYDVGDRLIGGGAIREHNALSRKDAGVVESRTINLPTVETASYLIQVTFLVKL